MYKLARLWPLLLCLMLLLNPAALGAEDSPSAPPESAPADTEPGDDTDTGADTDSETESESVGDFVIEDGKLLIYTGSDTDVYIPAEVTRIDGGAFANTPLIQRVVLHSGILSIDRDTFANCTEVALSLVESTMAHDFAVEYNLPYTNYPDDASLPQPPPPLPSDTPEPTPSAEPEPTPAPTPTPAPPTSTPAPKDGFLSGIFGDMTTDSWITLIVAAIELLLFILLILTIIAAIRSKGAKGAKGSGEKQEKKEKK